MGEQFVLWGPKGRMDVSRQKERSDVEEDRRAKRLCIYWYTTPYCHVGRQAGRRSLVRSFVRSLQTDIGCIVGARSFTSIALKKCIIRGVLLFQKVIYESIDFVNL